MGIASRFNESRSAATSPRRVRGFETVAAMLLAAGMALAVLVAPWPVAIVACGAVAAALSTALLAATRYSSRAAYGIALGLVMAALAAMLVVGVAPLRATAANVTNTFIDAWNAQFDGYVLHFAVSAPSDGAALMFALFTGLVVGLVVHAICLSRSMIAARLIPITFIVCGLFFQTILPASFACLLLGGALLGSCYARRDAASLRAVPAFAVTLAVIVGVSLLACAGYEGNTQLRDAKGNALATVDEFRFGSDTLPQGDLASAHRMSAVPEEGETDRLRVTFADEEAASNAAPLYLRGFAGVEYTGDAFNRMKPDQYEGEWTGLFTWLDAEGFNTLSQYSAYRSLDDEENGNATETLSVTVDAPGAYRRYAYAPAAATSDGAESLLDLYRTNGEVRGNESSTFDVVTGAPMAETMVPGDWVYEQAASLGSETGPDAGVAVDQGDANGEDLSARERNFLRSELAYRSFVYDRYLDVPSDTATVIERFFFEDDTWNVDESTLYSTVTRIRTLLDVSCDYNAQGVRFEGAHAASAEAGVGSNSPTGIANEGAANTANAANAEGAVAAAGTGTVSNDYVAWFLEDAREGNSAAFASAAVLAFRQVGVPARYVEGYLLDEETFEHMREAGESSCTLNESNAHAWVEVYVDGAGWMPVEVTPGFYDRVYAADEVVEIAREVAGGASDDSNVGTVAETPDWTDMLPEELRPFAWLGLALLFMLMAFIIMGAAELQRLVRLGWRSRRLRRAVACGEGSVLLYGRLRDLISDAGVHVNELDPHSCVGALAKAHPEVHAFECDRALSLMERERYGQIPLGEFEVSIVESLLEKLEAGNWERASVSRRIAYRYIGLYLIPLHLVTA
ncbi:transglutaminase family protein [Adlercreutzia sp. ZJ138]|uniref:transglutaminase-like domain-containing protein n=1 Tax=Adlercreutzia sp. ZJ138 TaxID=2709405 RepID=UPI0013EDE536|nr:transglutaminase domain-containing protein [Adlercreutzia sp. ZJ138]